MYTITYLIFVAGSEYAKYQVRLNIFTLLFSL